MAGLSSLITIDTAARLIFPPCFQRIQNTDWELRAKSANKKQREFRVVPAQQKRMMHQQHPNNKDAFGTMQQPWRRQLQVIFVAL